MVRRAPESLCQCTNRLHAWFGERIYAKAQHRRGDTCANLHVPRTVTSRAGETGNSVSDTFEEDADRARVRTLLPAATDVAPTAVTYGHVTGKSGEKTVPLFKQPLALSSPSGPATPESPDEMRKEVPCSGRLQTLRPHHLLDCPAIGSRSAPPQCSKIFSLMLSVSLICRAAAVDLTNNHGERCFLGATVDIWA